MDKDLAKQQVERLINKYELVRDQGKIKTYSEEETKKDFILPLFRALGWDIENKNEVSAEESIISSGRVDYGFYINDRIKFYLEAKPLKADINIEEFAHQAIRYSFNKGVTWAVLTDFESVKVFNAQSPSEYLGDKQYFEIQWQDYIERFDKLWELSKESLGTDLIDKKAEEAGKKLQKIPITDLLYKDLNECRKILIDRLGKWNPDVSHDLLDEGVQKLIDRLIFIRVLEDRKIEQNLLILLLNQWKSSTDENKPELYESMSSMFRELDSIYNSNLFSPHSFEKWEDDGYALEKVISILYGKKGYYEYDFSVMPADILGSVYENYLGHILLQSKKGVVLNKTSGKRKEQGIYYTPTFIVDYIVRNALNPVLDKCKSVDDLKKIKILDPACGSGSFLIKALEVINDKYKEFGSSGDEYTKLTILTENIYGVDLDEQAVEIARLNLLISAIDSRSKLPKLDKNIKIGNSLISGTDEELRSYFGKNYSDKKPFNWNDEFPEAFKQGGFDVIIGNPPYVDSESMVKSNPKEREFINDKYNSAKGNWDLYIPFWELASKLLSKNGIAAYITPNKWLSIKYGKELRKLFLDKIYRLCDCSNIKVFSAGNTPIIAFISGKPETEKIDIEYFDKNYNISKSILVNKKSAPLDDWGLLISIHVDFLMKLKKLNKVEEFLEVQNPFTVSEAYEIKNILEDNKATSDYLRFINTGTIDRYVSYWGINPTTYLKDKYRNPVINKNVLKQRFPKRYLQAVSPKIITSGMRNFESYLDEKGEFVAGKSTIISFSHKIKLAFAIGILNSKLIRFYIKESYSVLGIDGGINFSADLVKNLPFPNKVDDKKVVILVNKIIKLNREILIFPENSNRWNKARDEIDKTDKELNKLVYQLYDLNDEERKIIENT